MAVEKIESDRCIGCGQCYLACPSDVIRMDNQAHKAVVKYPEDCTLCAWCIVSCSQQAIIFTATMASPVFTSWG